MSLFVRFYGGLLAIAMLTFGTFNTVLNKYQVKPFSSLLIISSSLLHVVIL